MFRRNIAASTLPEEPSLSNARLTRLVAGSGSMETDKAIAFLRELLELVNSNDALRVRFENYWERSDYAANNAEINKRLRLARRIATDLDPDVGALFER